MHFDQQLRAKWHVERGGIIRSLIMFVTILNVVSAACAASFDEPPDNVLTATVDWTGPNNQFVTAIAEDATGWWWGTDNDGLWHYAPNAKHGQQWSHVRAQDGLYDDSVTALCVDRQGRVWVGSERRGVSVGNGSWWHNYDVMTGPLGVHVNAIALDPLTGDIWIASEAGLAIYADQTKSWRYITEANGLVSNDLTCIAFTSKGDALVGTASDGLLTGTAASGYTNWTRTNASAAAPTAETGSGLPSNQINCLASGKGASIYCGTSRGLASSADDGKTWTYLHGFTWPQKITPIEQIGHPAPPANTRYPMNDDYVTCLACDQAGHVFVGHRQFGCEVYQDDKPLYHSEYNSYGVCVRALATTTHGDLLVGNYGDGVSLVDFKGAASTALDKPAQATAVPPMPAPAPPPSTADLRVMAAKLSHLKKTGAQPKGYFLDEDWQTQGDWLGRYGNEHTILCGVNAPTDGTYNSNPACTVTVKLGHPPSSEDISRWIQWPETEDPRILYDPAIGDRREAEWLDHGDSVPMSYDGPDLWVTFIVPKGMHRISLYFVNSDGHTIVTRFRDFIVELKQPVPNVTITQSYTTPDALPTIAKARVSNFWPGVYENFAVTGPGKYHLRIDKNYSLNTILQGVFVDSLGNSAPAKTSYAWSGDFKLPTIVTAHSAHQSKADAAVLSQAEALWTKLDNLYAAPSSADLQQEDRLMLLRCAASANAPQTLLTSWRRVLGLWTDSDWKQFDEVTQQMHKAAALKPGNK